MEITYKKCGINHLYLLTDISTSTFKDTFGPDNTEEDMADYLEKSFRPDQVKRELLNPDISFYFAYSEKTLIGYFKINFGPAQTDLNDDNSLELERIYILKEFQGKGYGPHLLDKTVALAKENKLKYIWLGVWDKNERAIHVYGKRGFTVFAKHNFMLGKDEQTDILMRLEL